jgi:hypothetical protein
MNEVAQVGAGTINLFYPSLIFPGMAAPYNLAHKYCTRVEMPGNDKYVNLQY